ncbi:MAG: hypothetical protein ACXU9C_01715 [Xanthobacteraceae bacterium]
MGLFSGGNSSSSNTSNNYDQRQIITSTTDNSTTITNTLDGGAVAGALALANNTLSAVGDQFAGVLGFASQVVSGQNASQAQGYDFADHLFSHALDTVGASEAAAADAFQRAAQVQTATIGQLQNAYADAKGTTQAQQKMIFAALALAALVVMMRKG